MSHEPLKSETHSQLFISDHLHLREVVESEADHLYALVDENRQYLAEYLPWANGNTPSDSLSFVQKIRESRVTGAEYGFGIYDDDNLVGHISLMHLTDGKTPEIGYWIAETCSGKGVTTKAAKRVTQFGFETLGLDEIVIKAAVSNVGSNRVAQKLGYELVGTEESDNGTAINIWRKTK